MKRFYLTIVAMLCGFAVKAQTNELYAEDIQIELGATSADLEICMRNDDPTVCAFAFRLGLPDGITMALDKSGNKYVEINKDRENGHSYFIRNAADGADMICVERSLSPFHGNDGIVVTVPLTIAEDVANIAGKHKIDLYSISIANTTAQSIATSTEFTTYLHVGWEGCSLSVSLPESVNLADYAKLWLELTNSESGQKMHYVMTERTTYTFSGIVPNSTWNVVLRNERGDIFGKIDNIEVKDEDVSVTFSSLSKPQSVTLSVLTPEGLDVTAQTQVTWNDTQGNYIAQAAFLSGLPVGYQANYSIVLSQELAMVYNTPLLAEYTLKDGDNNITCQLDSIKQVQLLGKVKDAETGFPLSGAIISVSQTFGGKHTKTLTAKTDKNGVFTKEVSKVPTSLTFAATDYVSQTVNYDNGLDGLDGFVVPDVSLKPISGATITIDFTYTTVEGETQEWYSDYQNVAFELYNETKDCAINQFNVQYPQIVLLEEVEDGDVLRLTASSRTTNYTNSTNVGAFMPVTTTATFAEQKAEASFAIKELGRIQASFTTAGNASVVGSLYDVLGKLVKTYNYSNTSLTISNLADGNYTLVSMGSSHLFNTIYDLTQLPQTGLIEGTDYVKNTVEVQSGAISRISIDEVPSFDESKLYYTGDNTSFIVNKPSVVVGNYLTLTGSIDFKPDYATSVSNVQMIIDLPESCQFIENSVLVSNSTSGYTFDGNRITIPISNYIDRVRFCVIPTLGGVYAPSALVQFNLNGKTITQPIGSVNYTAKDLSISVPSMVAKNSVPISGTAKSTSNIEIYDNGVLIGQTTSLANGTWTTTCELNEPYDLSTHSIYAKITTKQGIELQSETVECMYDMNAIEVKTVTMINTAHPASSLNTCEYVTAFDFQNPPTSIPVYWYWPNYPSFTFLVDFTTNDTLRISDVYVEVSTSDGGYVVLPAIYSKTHNRWVATSQFNSSALPSNVAVRYNAGGYDMSNLSIYGQSMNRETGGFFVKNVFSEKNKVSATFTDNNGKDYARGEIKRRPKEERNDAENEMKEYNLFEKVKSGDTTYYGPDDNSDNCTTGSITEDGDSIITNLIEDLQNSNHDTRSLLERARDRQIQYWIDMAEAKMTCANPVDKVRLEDAVRRLRNSVTYLNAGVIATCLSIMLSATDSGGTEVEQAISNGMNMGNIVMTVRDFPPGGEGLNRTARDAIEVIREIDACPGSEPQHREAYPQAGPQVIMDPSGFVYEGVPSNRLQGVTATVYYKEIIEDMYGDQHENIVKWDATEYGQENPLFTDEYGYYHWDVPQGLWQVKFEKEGYETTYSDWLPVPPPQLDINIAMKQARQPEVKDAHAYEDGVEVEFDKYMMPELLTTENISVIAPSDSPEGEESAVEGTIELLNEETSYEDENVKFASRVRFVPKTPFTAKQVTLVVANSVKSYADIPMQDTYMQILDIEKEVKEIVVDSLMKVPYQGTGTITIQVLPADAAAGRTLTIKNSSSMILGVGTEQVIIDEDGKAEIIVSGELPGTAALTFSVEETDKTAVTIVNVEQIEPVATPTANFASGSMVEKGTQIFLYCETEGATIYYTLDGSCPCVNSEARKVYDGTPITIEKNTVIKAMAAAPDMEESEVATFVYIITLGDLNGDGKVDIADGVTVLNTMAEGKYDDFVDINHDQKVDIADFVTILNIMAANDSFIHQ